MSMKYIREHYNVPAKRGMKVNAQGHKGVIVGSKGPYLRIKIQGEKNILSFHPTWEMEYLKEKEKMEEQIEETEIIDFRSRFMYPVEKERKMKKERMYELKGKRVPTWNPFVGCGYNCSYCYAKDIAKRQKHRCWKCYKYIPHPHLERLKKKFKQGETVFVCSMGDISFATMDTFTGILDVISNQPKTTFYIQSKDPIYFREYLERFGCSFGDNVVLGTTIETNRNTREYSWAPLPQYRYEAMKLLKHSEYVTIEPIMNFDMGEMLSWIDKIKPEFVYIGYNSRDREFRHLPEPSLAKTEELIVKLEKMTEVRLKLIRKAWWEEK